MAVNLTFTNRNHISNCHLLFLRISSEVAISDPSPSNSSKRSYGKDLLLSPKPRNGLEAALQVPEASKSIAMASEKHSHTEDQRQLACLEEARQRREETSKVENPGGSEGSSKKRDRPLSFAEVVKDYHREG